MALITTYYTLGWYGVSGENCTAFDLQTQIGTYTWPEGASGPQYVGPYTEGTQDFTSASLIRISSFSKGGSSVWSLPAEANTWSGPGSQTRFFIKFDKLECGRMYLIKNPGIMEFEIPNFVPTAQGVDMGRVVPA